jgi:uncharacterized protein YjbJ (UPF0337 family)
MPHRDQSRHLLFSEANRYLQNARPWVRHPNRNCADAFRVLSYHPARGVMTMDWNRFEGNWKEMKGKVKEKWGKLTDDDLTTNNGKRDQLEGALQRRYGYAKDQARQNIDTWFSTLH